MKMKILIVPFTALLLSFAFTGCYSAHHNDRYYHHREHEHRYHHRHYDRDHDRDHHNDRDRDYGYHKY